MPDTTPCIPSCCSTPTVVEVPGPPGAEGPQGPQGETGPQGEPGENGTTPTLDDFTDYEAPNYTVTATPAQITGVAQILGDAGRYLIFARARFDAVAATFAASRVITTYLYNASTSANIADSTKAVQTPVITTQTQTLPAYDACVIYEAAGDNEVIQMFTSVSVIPSAGTLDVEEAEIVAIRLGD